MPLIVAVVWCSLIPLGGGVLLYGISVVVLPRETDRTDVVLGTMVIVLWLMCLVPAARSLAARVVGDPDGLTVHNALRTIRIGWVDVRGVDVIITFNSQALINGLWFGVAVAVRGRPRPLRILASWVRREDRAEAFAQRLRTLAADAAAGGPGPSPAGAGH
ncbi:hypothetical protein ACFFWC_21410 [Plantactinospora siamensis]|uniref:PH (Pleckstrin Homology) domain-containing protein n=2 Tax=Plantactinospora siamensis TaxID=555372 RepID=A0ABV6P5L9_9ACTN